MKLAVMKLVCLAALLGGIVILCLVFNVEQVEEYYQQVMNLLPKQEDGAPNLWLPTIIIGVLLVVLGGYGFLPRLRGKRNNIITYRGTHGDIILQLKPIRKVLLRVMRKMPEVYSIKLDVRPDKDRRRACIEADVVLKNSAALGARRCAKMVADCLSATARDVLGLEDLSMIRVNVKGVHVDIIATGRQMREQLALREEEESAAYALAHPPAASVSLDEDSTENRPAGIVDSQEQDMAAVDATVREKADAPGQDPDEEALLEPDDEEETPPEADEESEAEISAEGYPEGTPDAMTVSLDTPPLPADAEDVALPPLLYNEDEVPPVEPGDALADDGAVKTNECIEAASSPCQMDERNWDAPGAEEDVPEATDVDDLPEAAADDEELPPSSGEEKTDGRWR